VPSSSTTAHDHALTDRIKNYFVDIVLPLGHGTVLSNPDKPWLVWGYTNGHRLEVTNHILPEYGICIA
jgi:hypothetical protein